MGKKEELIDLKTDIERTQSLMIAYVTWEREPSQTLDYKELYVNIHLQLEKYNYSNPNPHRTLEEFWSFCKLKNLDKYHQRRSYVHQLYDDIVLDIERKLREEEDPLHWEKANRVLIDKYEPIRKQWLKAKNYIFAHEPDLENSIKESINSIESFLKIKTNDNKSTLGQLIQKVEIDDDIRKSISQVYGLVSNKGFVRHGGTEIEDLAKEDAKFFLEFAAVSIVYLKEKLKDDDSDVA